MKLDPLIRILQTSSVAKSCGRGEAYVCTHFLLAQAAAD